MITVAKKAYKYQRKELGKILTTAVNSTCRASYEAGEITESEICVTTTDGEYMIAGSFAEMEILCYAIIGKIERARTANKRPEAQSCSNP